MSVYDVGDLLRVSGAFTDAAGTAIDPTTVLFKYKVPAGTITTLTYGVDGALVKDSVGNYHVDLNMSVSGIFYFKFYSTGTGQAAAEANVTVNPTAF